jgi:hypothetical protein
MNTEDKIFQKIKEAAELDTNEKFDAMDKVWQKIETKLENKTLKKENKHWKTLGVAASFLLLMTLGILIFNANEEEIVPKINLKNEQNVVETNENVIESETTTIQNPIIENPVKTNEETTEKLVFNDEIKKIEVNEVPKEIEYYSSKSEETSKSIEREKYGYKTTTIHQDKVVKFANPLAEEIDKETETKPIETKKMNPLVVINGEVAKNGKKAMNDLEIESLVELKEPLYIINGVHYSEKEMFGPNPTSPYAPLDQQDITELKILLEEEAIKIYGEKGKKGVVIVTTKNNKPKAP